jgi:hypothetical protein
LLLLLLLLPTEAAVAPNLGLYSGAAGFKWVCGVWTSKKDSRTAKLEKEKVSCHQLRFFQVFHLTGIPSKEVCSCGAYQGSLMSLLIAEY